MNSTPFYNNNEYYHPNIQDALSEFASDHAVGKVGGDNVILKIKSPKARKKGGIFRNRPGYSDRREATVTKYIINRGGQQQVYKKIVRPTEIKEYQQSAPNKRLLKVFPRRCKKNYACSPREFGNLSHFINIEDISKLHSQNMQQVGMYRNYSDCYSDQIYPNSRPVPSAPPAYNPTYSEHDAQEQYNNDDYDSYVVSKNDGSNPKVMHIYQLKRTNHQQIKHPR